MGHPGTVKLARTPRGQAGRSPNAVIARRYADYLRAATCGARQAVYVGQPDDALDLARAAQTSADKAGLPALLAESLIIEAGSE
jgi:hypothetical protein